MAKQVTVTQRAYTLRLRGVDPQDQSWRDALWQTHEAVNKAAKAFGDWLLTLRGGLDHALADAKVKGGKGKPDRDPTDEERKGRRILLALSWLSVESKLGAPAHFIVATGEEETSARNGKVVGTLEEILKSRGVAEKEIGDPTKKHEDQPGTWIGDCAPSLTAAIRDDAVWVNRSKAFDEAVKSIGDSLTRDEVWDMLERFFGSREAYLAPAKGAEDESAEVEQEDKAKDLVQKAGQWLSSRFGTGKGADFGRMATVYEKIAKWAGEAQTGMAGDKAIADLATALSEFSPASNDLRGVLGLISGPGYKSATRNLLNQFPAKTSVTQEDLQNLQDKASQDAQKCKGNTGSKGQRPYSDAVLKQAESGCGFTYLQPGGPARHSEFAVMLDHAARRVSLAHTWIKRAEAERRRFEQDAKRMANVPDPAKKWLDTFCRERSGASGALEPYRIRRRAVDGWDKVVRAWAKCASEAERAGAVGAVQAECQANDEKFGDIQLFEALTDDDAVCVWHEDGDCAKPPDPQPLIDYVLASDAEFKKRRFKVPAYRHPHALLHPVFCDFGKSRWGISFAIHAAREGLPKAEKDVERRRKVVKKAERARAKAAANPEKETKAKAKLEKAQADLAEAEADLAWLSNDRAMKMALWTGSAIEPTTTLRWQSKRLAHDLALGEGKQDGGARGWRMTWLLERASRTAGLQRSHAPTG